MAKWPGKILSLDEKTEPMALSPLRCGERVRTAAGTMWEVPVSLAFGGICAAKLLPVGPAARGLFQPNLLGLKAWGSGPIEGAVHHLAHLVEPPIGMILPPLPPRRARAAVRSGQSQFHLLLFRHIKPFVHFRDQPKRDGWTNPVQPDLF